MHTVLDILIQLFTRVTVSPLEHGYTHLLPCQGLILMLNEKASEGLSQLLNLSEPQFPHHELNKSPF